MSAFVIRRAPHRMLDEHLAWIHEETAHSPQAWYYSAETLFESAECLRSAMTGRAARLLKTKGYMDSHYASYGMLLGYALECIFKGLWVTNGRTLVKDGKLTGIEAADDHDLSQLAHAVGVRITNQKEKDVVNRLSYFVRVAGRYPVARTPSEMAPRRVPGRGKVDPGFFSTEDWEIAQRVTKRLIEKLKSEMYKSSD